MAAKPKAAVPVSIASPHPLPVAVVAEPVAPELTTAQQDESDRKGLGQRRIQQTWEITQAIIAVAITIAMIYCAIKGIESQTLSNAFVLVVSMYLVRTNHTAKAAIPPHSR